VGATDAAGVAPAGGPVTSPAIMTAAIPIFTIVLPFGVSLEIASLSYFQ